MRVSIEHNEKKAGIIFQKTLIEVVVKVDFSAEEQAVIRSRKLKDYIVIERVWDAKIRDYAAKHPDHYDAIKPPHLWIGDLVKGADKYLCANPMEAKQYEARLTEGLKTLKAFLQGNEGKAESKNFEL